MWYTGGFGERKGGAMMELEYLKNHVKSLKPAEGTQQVPGQAGIHYEMLFKMQNKNKYKNSAVIFFQI